MFLFEIIANLPNLPHCTVRVVGENQCAIVNRTGIDGVFRHVHGTSDPLPHDSFWYLLMEWSSTRVKADGEGGMVEKMETFLADMLERGLALDAVIAQSEAQAKAMWKIREGHAEAGRADGPAISYDMSVATTKIPAFVDQGIAAAKAILPDIKPQPLGHIGDGNLHYGFRAPDGMSRETWNQYTPAITRAINDLIRDFGGSISAEHGIGKLKINLLRVMYGTDGVAEMRALKRVFDPSGRLNAGNLFAGNS